MSGEKLSFMIFVTGSCPLKHHHGDQAAVFQSEEI